MKEVKKEQQQIEGKEKKQEPIFIQYIKDRTLKKNKNFLMLFVGATGSGKSYSALRFAEMIDAQIVANPGKLKEAKVYGYTVIDSLKVILEVPVTEYMQMYGKTPERALIFLKVESGRSPMIAVKVGRFSTEMRPAIIVLHGVDKVDPIAIKIAEAEKIPLLKTNMAPEKIKEALLKIEN